MVDAEFDVRSYMDPDDIAKLSTFEDGHYWHLSRRRVLNDALDRFGMAPRFLDIGCGPGTTTTYFNRQGHTVDYADVHPEALELARTLAARELGADRTAALRFTQLDIARDPVPTGYDGVMLLDVIEHLPDDVGALRSVRASLQPGAHLIVTVPAFPALWSRFDEVVHHKRRYTTATARAAITEAGFDVEHTTYFFAPLFLGAGAVKLLREGRQRLPARWRAHDDDLEGLMEARTSPLLTKVMVAVLGLERPIIRRSRLPFGTSLLCIARAR